VNEFLRVVSAGVGSGGIYALVALGIVIVYRGSGIVNFAGGGFALLGGATYYELNQVHGVSFVVAMVAGVVAAMVAGVLTQVVVLYPMRRAAPLNRVIATLAVGGVIQAYAVHAYGGVTTFLPSFLPAGTFDVGDVLIQQDRLYILLITVGLGVALFVFYRFTRFGLATTGVAENERVTATMGWSPNLVAMGNWALGGALSGFAGIFLASVVDYGISVPSYTVVVVPALAAALVGGFASFPLTIAGGLLIGMLQAMSLKYVTEPGWADAMPFLVIIVIMVVRGRAVPLRSHRADRLPQVGTGKIRRWLVAVVVLLGGVSIASLGDLPATSVVTALILALLCLSVVVVLGYGGQLSLAQFTLAGMGALFAARLASDGGLSFPLVLVGAVALTLPIGVIFALPALRIRGVNLAVVTLGLAVAVSGVVFSNPSLTKGPKIGGVAQELVIPRASIFGYQFDEINHPTRYAICCLILVVVACLVVANVRRGRSGRQLLAVRDNERAAMSLGMSVTGTKLYAFGLASTFAAAGGVLITYRNTTVEYGQFGVFSSIQLVLLAVLGGVGSIIGAVVGGLMAPSAFVEYLVDSNWGIGEWFALIASVLVLLTIIAYPDGVVLGTRDLVLGTIGARRRRDDMIADDLGAPVSAAAVQRVAPKRLEIRDVEVMYGSTRVLDGLSITVDAGEVVGLIGPNGAGKTTLIDLASGFVRGSGGSVVLDGNVLDSLSPAQRCRAGLTRSFQSLELFEDMTVQNNLRVASEPRHAWTFLSDLIWPRTTDLGQTAMTSIVEFDLGSVLEKYPTQLSYAQRRLVAVARAVACGPSILLLDEPAAGLDEASTQELAHLIRRLSSEWGIGVLLVEHDVQMVMETCDRVVAIDFGRTIVSDIPEAVRNHPGVISAYLGAP